MTGLSASVDSLSLVPFWSTASTVRNSPRSQRSCWISSIVSPQKCATLSSSTGTSGGGGGMGGEETTGSSEARLPRSCAACTSLSRNSTAIFFLFARAGYKMPPVSRSGATRELKTRHAAASVFPPRRRARVKPLASPGVSKLAGPFG